MKKLASLILTGLFMLTLVATVDAAVTIRYYNKDSKTHKMTVKISGSSKTVEFGSSRTASVTIQGSGTEAEIETSCGKIKVKDGDNIEIKDGCITIK